MRIYLDACAIIYLLEGTAQIKGQVSKRLHVEAERRIVVTSRLSRLECRVRPLRQRENETLQVYDSFFAARDVELLEVTDLVLERATELRAKYGFRTPDAIHLASAIEAKTDIFLTGDADLARCKEMIVEICGGPTGASTPSIPEGSDRTPPATESNPTIPRQHQPG